MRLRPGDQPGQRGRERATARARSAQVSTVSSTGAGSHCPPARSTARASSQSATTGFFGSREHNFKQQAKLSTWLYRIAINEALDFLRKQKNATSLQSSADLTLAQQLMADDYFDGDATQARLQEAIAELPEVQRTVFNLRYFDEMKYEEISVILSTSVGALKASYHLAVKKLRKIMDAE